jgi:hypothetical protein
MKTFILADIGIAVVATLSFTFGLQNEGLFATASIALGGVLVGYLLTTYLEQDYV